MDQVRRFEVARHNEAGFGMVSLLVALVLLAIGVVALSTSSAFVSSLQTDASSRSIAVTLAVAQMEELKRAPAHSLRSKETTSINELGVENTAGLFRRTVTIREDRSAPELVQAEVEVGYPGGLGRMGSVRLVTILYRGDR